jgi:acetyl-CoA acyltransferase
MLMRDAVIVDAIRTPLGRGKAGVGGLSHVHPADLLAMTLKGLVERTGIDPGRVDDVLGGCVSQTNEQTFNITRNAVLGAGFPEHVPATTIDRQCGSSQQAASFAAQGVMAGAYDLVIACGVESMSRVPLGSSTHGSDPFGPLAQERYSGLIPQGISAELIAAKWGLSREDVDALSAESHRRAAEAADSGAFDNEVLPIQAPNADGEVVTVAADEGIRRGTTVESLAGLRPVFQDDMWTDRFPQIPWVVTAGNASQLTDGAAAMLITSSETAAALGLKPRARFVDMAVVGDDPVLMLTGPIPATTKVLERAGMSIGDIDLFEVNEAFAPVVLAWAREHGVDLDKVNVHGGAIALGHPVGASGARLMTTLLNAMEQRGARYGLQTMCEGGGQANATIIELLG